MKNIMEANEIHIKVWDPLDIETGKKILDAASITHNQPLNSIDRFIWKFRNSPFGNAIVCYAESEDGLIAGTVAFGMYELKRNDRIIKAALSYETFVHPSFQGKGLFTRLTKAAVNAAKEKGVELLFNFPNSKSLPGFKKMGWSYSKCIKFWVRPASFLKFIFKFNPRAFKQPFIADEVDSIDNNQLDLLTLDNLNIIKDNTGKIIANRKTDYLKWRFQTFPLNNYKYLSFIEGSCIVRTGKRGNYSEVQILELFPSKGQLNRKFIKEAIKNIKSTINPDLIAINISSVHPANALLSRSGFVSLPNNINLTIYPLTKEFEEFTEGKDWIITGTEFHTY